MLPTLQTLRLRSKTESLAIFCLVYGDGNIAYVEWDKDESLDVVAAKFSRVMEFNKKASQTKGLERKSDIYSKRKFTLCFYLMGQHSSAAIEHLRYSPSKCDLGELLQLAWDTANLYFQDEVAIFAGVGKRETPAMALPSPKDEAIEKLAAIIGDSPDPVELAVDVIKTYQRSAKKRKQSLALVTIG